MNTNEYAGEYEIYCKQNEKAYTERIKEEYSNMSNKISKYEILVDDIESSIDSNAEDNYKLQIIKALIEDFKGETKC